MAPEWRQDGRSSSAPDYGIPRCEPGSPGTRMARYCDTNPMTTIIAKLVARAIAHEPRVGNISSS
jgi:hypothetical protein